MTENEAATARPNENDSPPEVVSTDSHEAAPNQDPPSGAPSNIPTTETEPEPTQQPPADLFQSLQQPLPRWMNPPPKLRSRFNRYLHKMFSRLCQFTIIIIVMCILLTIYKYKVDIDQSDFSHLEFDWERVNPASYLTPMDNPFKYNILLDGHSHTTYSDGRMKPEQLLKWAIANGYNAIIVSDHNTIDGALEAQKIAKEKYNDSIVVIPGMEYRIHMQFIGIQSNPFGPFNKPYPTNEDLKGMIDKVHEMGGLVTVNHIPWSNKTERKHQVPTLPDHPTREELYEMGVDGFEIINGDVFDFETYLFAEKYQTLKISGSDVHHPSEAAYAWTLLNAPNITFEGIMSGLRGKETTFLFDATGTRPRYYPADNKEYLALLPITALANAVTSFYDDYRGMVSFQGGFCHERNSTHPDLKYHYIAHTSIDVIEERVSTSPETSDTYLGLLYAMEDLAIWIPNKHPSKVCGGPVCNPFYNLDGKKSIVSKRFVAAIDAIGKMTGEEVSSSSP
ncbi:25412_t:CDS:2 [Dentiscutata erythropus]|uniref:25412_t:CDS:1 n=1 Tax=Dentiscutata erythropus TaxID=1348616 RepID=A0A9N9EQU1_9GLOM|nr:25412_t:CDS:2 [Dentiscutata erythropus]